MRNDTLDDYIVSSLLGIGVGWHTGDQDTTIPGVRLISLHPKSDLIEEEELYLYTRSYLEEKEYTITFLHPTY